MKQEFTTIIDSSGMLQKHSVYGENVKLTADTEKQFFTYEDKNINYVIERATGTSIANSTLNKFDAIKKANKVIKNAITKGVYHKKLFLAAQELAKHNINTPVNIIYKKRVSTRTPGQNENNIKVVGLLN